MKSEFESMLKSMRPQQKRKIVVVNAIDPNGLRAVENAYNMGFVDVILCGNESDIKHAAETNNIDISKWEIIQCDDEISCAKRAVELVRENRADIIMKGHIHTADVLRPVLNRESGIRDSGVLSHVSVMHSLRCNRRLFLTDMAMVMYPDLDKKVQMVKNAVALAHSMGVDMPRVAPVCAVETVNPAMQATLDAEELRKMNECGEIVGCKISGPVGFDIAVSKDAAAAKGITGPVQGDADVILFDNIEAGNNVVKTMVIFGDWIFGGVVIGARVPVIINSRSDNDVSKLFSICCACNM